MPPIGHLGHKAALSCPRSALDHVQSAARTEHLAEIINKTFGTVGGCKVFVFCHIFLQGNCVLLEKYAKKKNYVRKKLEIGFAVCYNKLNYVKR